MTLFGSDRHRSPCPKRRSLVAHLFAAALISVSSLASGVLLGMAGFDGYVTNQPVGSDRVVSSPVAD